MSPRSLASVDVAVLGLGAVGRAFARALEREGSRRSLALHSRRLGVASSLAAELGGGNPRSPLRASDDLASGALAVDLALLCVRDDELGECAAELARAGPPREGAVLLHTSGFHGVSVLEPAARTGWSTGGLHPLASVPRAAGDADPFTGTAFAVAGEPRALALARRVAEAVGGSSFELAGDAGARARYHAAAALLSNGLVALFDAADELFAGATTGSAEDRRRALAELLRSTARDLGLAPPEELLTGPIARGDRRVVAGHLSALRGRPATLELYRVLSARMVALARRAGRVEPARLDEIAALLSAADPR